MRRITSTPYSEWGEEENVVLELSLLTARLSLVERSRAWIAGDPALGFMICFVCGTAVKPAIIVI